MRIGVDYRSVLTTAAGIARYTRGLCDGLAHALAPPDELRLYGYLARRAASDWPSGRAVVPRVGRVPARAVAWLGRFGYGIETHFGDVDLFHFTDFAPLPLRRTPWTFTLHDVSFLVEPSWHEPRAVAALTRVVERLVPQARAIFVHSAHTAGEATRLLGVDPARIAVVPPGVGDAFRRPPSQEARERVVRTHALPPRYVLALGTLEPRKNVARLVAAFERVAAADPSLHLVVAGARGWLDAPILAAIDRSPLRARIHRIGAVADRDVPALIAGAAIVAYVSLYEGFGLPALEALALGVPAVVSSTSSLPEVVDDAALCVDPLDPAAIADALAHVLGDDAVAARLRLAGPARAASFTWARTAQATLDGYRRALGGAR